MGLLQNNYHIFDRFSGAFFLIAGISLSGVIFLWFFLPETKGVSLEEMETLFGGQSLQQKADARGAEGS